MNNAERILQQIAAFPRAIVFVEKRGDSASNLVGQAIEENESRIPGTYIGVVAQDAPDLVEAMGVEEFPTVLVFEGGKEKCRANFDALLAEPEEG